DHVGPAQIRPVTASSLASRITWIYRCHRTNADGQQKPALFPITAARVAVDVPDMLPHLRPLAGVTHTPLVRPDGTPLTQPRYDPETPPLPPPHPPPALPPPPPQPPPPPTPPPRRPLDHNTPRLPPVSPPPPPTRRRRRRPPRRADRRVPLGQRPRPRQLLRPPAHPTPTTPHPATVQAVRHRRPHARLRQDPARHLCPAHPRRRVPRRNARGRRRAPQSHLHHPRHHHRPHRPLRQRHRHHHLLHPGRPPHLRPVGRPPARNHGTHDPPQRPHLDLHRQQPHLRRRPPPQNHLDHHRPPNAQPGNPHPIRNRRPRTMGK